MLIVADEGHEVDLLLRRHGFALLRIVRDDVHPEHEGVLADDVLFESHLERRFQYAADAANAAEAAPLPGQLGVRHLDVADDPLTKRFLLYLIQHEGISDLIVVAPPLSKCQIALQKLHNDDVATGVVHAGYRYSSISASFCRSSCSVDA